MQFISLRCGTTSEYTPPTGCWAIVDDDDFERFGTLEWRVKREHSDPYVVCYREEGDLRLHHEIAKCAGMLTEERPIPDHKNGCTFDNRRCNIRPANSVESTRNRRLTSNKTGWPGVSPEGNKWIARIRFQGERLRFGPFDTSYEAAVEYQRQKFNRFGEYARRPTDMCPLGEVGLCECGYWAWDEMAEHELLESRFPSKLPKRELDAAVMDPDLRKFLARLDVLVEEEGDCRPR